MTTGLWAVAVMVCRGYEDLESMLLPRLKAKIRVDEDGDWSEMDADLEDLEDMGATANAAIDLGNKMLRDYYFLPGPEGVPLGVSLQEQFSANPTTARQSRPAKWLEKPEIPFSIAARQINHQHHTLAVGNDDDSCVSGFPYQTGNGTWKPCPRFFFSSDSTCWDVSTTFAPQQGRCFRNNDPTLCTKRKDWCVTGPFRIFHCWIQEPDIDSTGARPLEYNALTEDERNCVNNFQGTTNHFFRNETPPFNSLSSDPTNIRRAKRWGGQPTARTAVLRTCRYWDVYDDNTGTTPSGKARRRDYTTGKMETIRMLGELTYYGRTFFEKDYWVCPRSTSINGYTFYTRQPGSTGLPKYDDSTKEYEVEKHTTTFRRRSQQNIDGTPGYTPTCADSEYWSKWKTVPDYNYEPRYNYRTEQTGTDSDGNPITRRVRIEPYKERVEPFEKDVTYRYYRSKDERRRGKGDGEGCPQGHFDLGQTKYYKGCPTLAVMKSWEEILAEWPWPANLPPFDAPEQKVEYPEITEDNNVCPVAQWKSATNKCWDYGVWLCGRQWDKCSPSGRYYCKLEKHCSRGGGGADCNDPYDKYFKCGPYGKESCCGCTSCIGGACGSASSCTCEGDVINKETGNINADPPPSPGDLTSPVVSNCACECQTRRDYCTVGKTASPGGSFNHFTFSSDTLGAISGLPGQVGQVITGGSNECRFKSGWISRKDSDLASPEGPSMLDPCYVAPTCGKDCGSDGVIKYCTETEYPCGNQFDLRSGQPASKACSTELCGPRRRTTTGNAYKYSYMDSCAYRDFVFADQESKFQKSTGVVHERAVPGSRTDVYNNLQDWENMLCWDWSQGNANPKKPELKDEANPDKACFVHGVDYCVPECCNTWTDPFAEGGSAGADGGVCYNSGSTLPFAHQYNFRIAPSELDRYGPKDPYVDGWCDAIINCALEPPGTSDKVKKCNLVINFGYTKAENSCWGYPADLANPYNLMRPCKHYRRLMEGYFEGQDLYPCRNHNIRMACAESCARLTPYDCDAKTCTGWDVMCNTTDSSSTDLTWDGLIVFR